MEETKGNTGRYEIKEAESIEILIIVDNYVDLLLPDSRFALRVSVLKEKGIPEGTLLAEHGLCLLISVDGHRILFDTGYTETAVMNNIKMLDVDLSKIEAIIISHFHVRQGIEPRNENFVVGCNYLVAHDVSRCSCRTVS